MKSLCLTGAEQDALDMLVRVLQAAGLTPARAAELDPSITMSYWHEQALASALTADLQATGQGMSVRWCRQLAGEIFMANMRSQAWGWADARSTQLLEFWRTFDPHLYFILACSPLEQVLAAAIAGEEDPDLLPVRIDAWETRLLHVLRFHARHPDRCLLVDVSDAVAHGGELVARCRDRWRLPLSTTLRFVREEHGSDRMALYLARQMIRERPRLADLERTRAGAVEWLGSSSGRGAPQMTLPDAIIGYRDLRQRCRRGDAFAPAYAGEPGEATVVRQAALGAPVQAEAVHEMEKQALSGQARTTALRDAAALQAAQHALAEAELEGDLVRAQLQRVKEEMQHYVAQYQSVRRKWAGFLARTPNYCGFIGVEVLAIAAGGRTAWRVTELETAAFCIPELRFFTVVADDAAGIVFTNDDGNGPLLRWPAAANGEREVTVLPQAPAAGRGVDLVDGLATRDWQLLRMLVRLLAQVLSQPGHYGLPGVLPAMALHGGMRRLDAYLDACPAMLRFDGAGLKREQVHDDYEQLWITLENLSWAGRCWAHWDFRLSCGAVGQDRFGRHPRLEFPAESGPAVLEHWFAESSDEDGVKLEWRFAAPDAVDMAVWQRMSNGDQAFLRALVGRLPEMLAMLAQQGVTVRRGWPDWQLLAGRMRDIMAIRRLL